MKADRRRNLLHLLNQVSPNTVGSRARFSLGKNPPYIDRIFILSTYKLKLNKTNHIFAKKWISKHHNMQKNDFFLSCKI